MSIAVEVTHDDLMLAIWQHGPVKPYSYCTVIAAMVKCQYGMDRAFSVDRKCACTRWARMDGHVFSKPMRVP